MSIVNWFSESIASIVYAISFRFQYVKSLIFPLNSEIPEIDIDYEKLAETVFMEHVQDITEKVKPEPEPEPEPPVEFSQGIEAIFKTNKNADAPVYLAYPVSETSKGNSRPKIQILKTKQNVTREMLHETFYINDTDKNLRYKKGKGKVVADQIAGNLTKRGRNIRFRGLHLFAHEIVWAMFSKTEKIEFPVLVHIDGDVTNNTKQNLRKVAQPEMSKYLTIHKRSGKIIFKKKLTSNTLAGMTVPMRRIGKTLKILFNYEWYEASSVVWFLKTGIFLEKKKLVYQDNNELNIKLENLQLKSSLTVRTIRV